ncbi:Bud site selection protein, Revert to axial protein 1 [Mortierella sp. GBA43]|nr:Bud site selection protein, Revert to axial protein 1 [Mortierella sp. GBA43]
MDTATGLPDSRRSKQLHRGSIQGLSQGMNLTYSACSDNPRYQNLPSLWHVLHRKTLPPVCLFNFYLHMRDHENSSEQVDFWLDVTAHELLWRLHIRATKRRLAQERAERDLRMRLDRQEMEEEEERRRIETEQWRLQEEEEAAAKGHQKQDSITADMYEPHLSAINRYLEISERGSEIELSAASSSVNLPGDMEHEYHQPGAGPITPAAAVAVALPGPSPDTGSLLARTGSESSHPADGSGGRGVGTGGGVVVIQAEPVPRAGAGVGHPYRSGTFETTTTTTTSSGAMPVPQPTPAAKKRATTSGASAVTKDDLVKSAERIYCLYLAPQAEKSIRIPSTVRRRIAQFMDSRMMDEAAVAAAGRVSSSTLMTGLDGHAAAAAAGETVPVTSSEKSDHEKSNHHSSSRSSGSMGGLMAQPDQDLGLAFAEAREIVFEEMESCYFPRFLNARAFGNMVHAHRLTRVILGLFMLFIGFSMALCMIFLNLQPRSLRAWTLIPMFIGIMLCTTFQFNICPVMAALGVSETKWMQFSKINESYILNLHRKRALKVVVVAILYTICVGTVFGLIPGHRL